MKLLLHDLPEDAHSLLPKEGVDVVQPGGRLGHCTGCFGCWIKTPGACVIKDDYADIGARMAHSEEMWIISRCAYGGYSPFVKMVMDRSIPYIHPYFVMRQGEMHHKQRYARTLPMRVWFWGEVGAQEQALAEQVVRANAVNLCADVLSLRFVRDLEQLRGAMQ